MPRRTKGDPAPSPAPAAGKAFLHVTARVFVHATEAEERVLGALAHVLDADLAPPPARAAFLRTVTRTASEGHHGNPIVILEAQRKRAADVEAFWARVMREAAVRDALAREYALRLDDELTLHARFDKQAAAQGRLRLADTDDCVAVRAKVAAFPKRRETALRSLSALFA